MEMCYKLLLVLLLCAGQTCSRNDLSGDGENPFDEFFPAINEETKRNGSWHAYIDGEVQCGGALTTSKHVLTAAHCVSMNGPIHTNTVDVSSLKVILGVHNMSDLSNSQLRTVENILIHQEFNFDKEYADIAILTLSEPVTLNTYVNTVDLPMDPLNTVPDNATCYATGFGVADANNKVPEILRQFPATYIEWNKCQYIVRSLLPGKHLQESLCCADLATGGLDVCEADSGGPLVCLTKGKWKLQGLVGFGGLVDCGRQDPELPGIYTDVQDLYEWIQRSIDI